MRAHVAICSPTGQETLSVGVEDFSPFVELTVRGTTVDLTRDEARKVSDALRAAGRRRTYDDEQNLGSSRD